MITRNQIKAFFDQKVKESDEFWSKIYDGSDKVNNVSWSDIPQDIKNELYDFNYLNELLWKLIPDITGNKMSSGLGLPLYESIKHDFDDHIADRQDEAEDDLLEELLSEHLTDDLSEMSYEEKLETVKGLIRQGVESNT